MTDKLHLNNWIITDYKSQSITADKISVHIENSRRQEKASEEGWNVELLKDSKHEKYDKVLK